MYLWCKNTELIYIPSLLNTNIEGIVNQRKRGGGRRRPVWEWSGCNPCICAVNKVVWNCRLQLKSHVNLVPEEGLGSLRCWWGVTEMPVYWFCFITQMFRSGALIWALPCT